MTEEEVNELFKDTKLYFNSYYKYQFTFKGEEGDYVIYCIHGGCHGDIYKDSITAKDHWYLDRVREWTGVTVFKKDNDKKAVFDYYDY